MTAIAMMAMASIYPQKSSAEGFTGEGFLAWEQPQQRAYLEAQLVMASTIATRSDADRAECIAQSFFDARGLSDAGFESAVDRIKEFSDYHPSSILVVMIEGEYGTYEQR